jgi:putative transposase
MAATDVQETLTLALTGVKQVRVQHRPHWLPDNGPAFIAEALAEFLKPYDIQQIHGRPHHPQTPGKIERYHRSMKSIVLLNTVYFPWELEPAIADFVAYYNYERYHESLDNVTPADMFFGRHKAGLIQREIIKQQTLLQRRSLNRRTDLHIVQ